MMEQAQQIEQVKASVAPVLAQAQDMAVTCPAQYETAAAFLKNVKSAQKTVKDFFAPLKSKAHDAWKAITTAEADALRPLGDAEATVKRLLVDYATEQERIRQEEQRRLQAEADERARKERERLEREAARLKTPELREQRIEQAAAVVAPVIEVATVQPKIAGQSIRKTWTARVLDVQKLPREWLIVNEQALQAFARATKGSVAIAGVEFIEVSSLASSGR